MTFWWDKGNKSLSISSFRKYAKQNKKDYHDDPDVRTGMVWGVNSNHARKGIDSCFDISFKLGYIEINYTNWNYNKKARKKAS